MIIVFIIQSCRYKWSDIRLMSHIPWTTTSDRIKSPTSHLNSTVIHQLFCWHIHLTGPIVIVYRSSVRPHFDAFDVLWLQYVGGSGLGLVNHDCRLVGLWLWCGVEHSDIERYRQTTGNHQLTVNRHLKKIINWNFKLGRFSHYQRFIQKRQHSQALVKICVGGKENRKTSGIQFIMETLVLFTGVDRKF